MQDFEQSVIYITIPDKEPKLGNWVSSSQVFHTLEMVRTSLPIYGINKGYFTKYNVNILLQLTYM